MGRRFSSHGWLVGLIVLGLLLSCCIKQPGAITSSAAESQSMDAAEVRTATPQDEPPALRPASGEGRGNRGMAVAIASDGSELWYEAIAAATEAANLAQSAITAPQWDEVAQAWARSVTLLQSIPSDDPRRLFSQRKAREYLQNLQTAQTRAERIGAKRAFPSLGSDVLDEQVSLYRSYVATLGPPDILVMGSSRALQGFRSPGSAAGSGPAGTSGSGDLQFQR